MAKGSDSPFPSVFLDEQAADPATPPADRWRLFAKSGGIYAINAAGTVVGPFAGSTTTTITTANAVLGAKIALPAATYTNIVSVSLAAGTWDIWAWLCAAAVAVVTDQYAQIWDGAAQLAQAHVQNGNVGGTDAVTIPAFAGSVVLAATTTIYLRGYSGAAAEAFGTANVGAGGGSKIHAMKIA